MDQMNQIYSSPRERMLLNQFNWPTLPLAMVACRGPYVFMEEDEILGDIVASGGQLVQLGLPLLGMTVIEGGYARTDTAVIPLVPASPDPVTFLVIVEMTGVTNEAKLIVYIDEAIGLPFVPNGQDQTVQPDWIAKRGWFRP
jgi:hypothetical protein